MMGAARAADSSFSSPANSAPNVSDDSVLARPPNSTLSPRQRRAARTNTRRRRTRNDTSSPASAAMAAISAGSCPGS